MQQIKKIRSKFKTQLEKKPDKSAVSQILIAQLTLAIINTEKIVLFVS